MNLSFKYPCCITVQHWVMNLRCCDLEYRCDLTPFLQQSSLKPLEFLSVEGDGVSFVCCVNERLWDWGGGWLPASGTNHLIIGWELSGPPSTSWEGRGAGEQWLSWNHKIMPMWWSLHKYPEGRVLRASGLVNIGGAGRVALWNGAWKLDPYPFPRTWPYADLLSYSSWVVSFYNKPVGL